MMKCTNECPGIKLGIDILPLLAKGWSTLYSVLFPFLSYLLELSIPLIWTGYLDYYPEWGHTLHSQPNIRFQLSGAD